MPLMLAVSLAFASRLVLAAALASGAADAAPAPALDSLPVPAANLELQRYFGRWYVIARLPGSGDGGLGAYFEFTPRADGRVDDIYYTRGKSFDRPHKATGRVARPDPARPARWQVDRGWFSSEERLILYVSPDYRHAVAGDAARNAAWVLAREPEIAEWSYAGLLARLAMQGYDVSRFRRVPQKPEQVGRPGFE